MTIDRYVRAATRDNTRRSYRSAIEHFEVTWGGFLPATADSVARYLADHAERLSAATLKLRLAALARWHRDQGFPDPTKAPLVRTVLKGIREEHPYRQKQAKPLAITQLQQLDQWLSRQIAQARQHGSRRLGVWLRNRAMVLLGFWRAFRSDELCRLTIEDITLAPGAGMSLYLRRSKGDRQAEGRLYKVPALRQCCPVEACQDWLDFLDQPSGALFRAIDRWGNLSDVSLHPNSIVPLLRQLLSDAGIDAVEAFSSHSLRRGFATWASASGWEIKVLMEYVGWRDTQTALRYVEAKSPFEQALMQIPTEMASPVGQPRLANASQARLRALTVQLTLEPQRPRSRKHHQARTVIEAHCLKPFEVEHQTDGHYRIEVPATSDEHLDDLRLAKDARATVNDRCYRSIVSELTDDTKALINDLLVSPPGIEISGWQRLKREIRKPTNKEIRSYLQHLKWLRDIVERLPSVHAIPVTKRRQFANEARALDVAKMARIPARKRYALAVVLIRQQYAQALDDTAELLIKLMRQLETTAQQNLLTYQMEQTQRTDRLVSCFKDVLTAMEAEPNPWQSLQAVVGDKRQEWLDECEEHLAYAGNNYLPFMLRPFRAKRSLLYNCLDILTFQSTSSDTLSIQLIELLRKTRSLKAETLDLRVHAPDLVENIQQTRWTLDKWRRLIFIRPDSLTVHRKYFELAVLNLVKQELKSADLAVVHGDRFDDHRVQLVSWSGYEQEIDQYGLEVELPMEPKALISHLKDQLTQVSRSVDAAFPNNTHATIEDGRIVIKRNQKQGLPTNWQALDDDITRRLGTRSIVDVLVDAERWLGLHREFGPLSGYEGRVEDPRLRFIATLFCYGCNLGPSQTADSIKQLNRRQIAWLNLNHVTEDRLDRAIVKVINAYKKYELPGYWGTGRRAAADGTKWNLYEQNLLSEYHIRYGGYGGIGYYHVSDTYIALFSHFIPCGVHEAVYILDGLLENQSDIQPDTLHGDTQAQSYPVFGLAYLLGIKLMPRIRNLKDLNFYRPDRRFRYAHIEELFNGHIDWARIERHLPDMLRVAVSIKLGKITASTILRRLGTYSRKNKLYFAFRELGKVVRTGFLLNYIDDVELRQTIHAATNKNEQFNGFAKWSFFGGSGIIAANLRHEQQKVVKYNHLVANMLILHNVEALSRVLRDMAAEGIAITEDVLKALSPYRTRHINRFGDYTLDLKRPVGQQLFDLKLAELASQGASKARPSVEDETE